jgi:hypothetical protein
MPAEIQNTCPFCGVEFEHGASACPSCDLPLLTADEIATANLRAAATDSESIARVGMLAVADRRPRPEYTIGDLRRVVVATNQAEADMLEDMLRSEGIPCVVRRASRADLPDFGASGQREILVPEGGLSAARDLLLITPLGDGEAIGLPITMTTALMVGVALVVLCVIIALAFA